MALTDLPYAQRAAEIERQRRYAELLQQQAAEPLQSQQVSGIVVPTSPWLGLAKMLQAGLGGYSQRKADEAAAELKKQGAEEAKKYFTDLATYAQKGEKTGETPMTTEISGYGATQPLPVLNVQDGKFSQAMKDVYTPATKAGMLARMMEGMSSENPDVAKYASTFGTALMPTTPEIGAVNPADWTPESLTAYKSSGKYSDLVPVTKAKTPTTFDQEWEIFKKENPNGTLAQFKQLGTAPQQPLRVNWNDPSLRKDWTADSIKAAAKANDSSLLVPTDTNEGAGGRESVFIGRSITAGNQAAKTIENIVEKPSTTSGWLGGQTSHSLLGTTVGGLKNILSDKDVNDYNIMVSGLERNLAAIETSGLVPSGALTSQMGNVVFKPGDTEGQKLRRLAEARQIITEGLTPLLANPRIGADQRKLIKDIVDRVEKAVPLSHHDLTVFEMQKDPKKTISDLINESKSPISQSSNTGGFTIVGVQKTQR